MDTPLPIELQAYRIMAETGMTACELAETDMSDYARLTHRQTPAQAAIAALDAQHLASAPQAPQQPPAPVQQLQQPPQGIDPDSDEYFLAWRANRHKGGEGHGIFRSVGSRSDAYTSAVRAQSGRTAYSQRNISEPPRLEGRFVNQDDMLDTRTKAQRFSTPGNAFNL